MYRRYVPVFRTTTWKKFDDVITGVVNIFSSKLTEKWINGSERECVFHILRTPSPRFLDCFASPDFTSKLAKCLVWAQLDGWSHRANPTYISPPRPREFEPPTFPSPFHTRAPAAPRVIPANPRVTCSPASAFDSLSWLDLHHLPQPTSPAAAAAAAAAAVTRLPHAGVGSTHAPGISITALTRISWTSSVFTNRKKHTLRWVQRCLGKEGWGVSASGCSLSWWPRCAHRGKWRGRRMLHLLFFFFLPSVTVLWKIL